MQFHISKAVIAFLVAGAAAFFTYLATHDLSSTSVVAALAAALTTGLEREQAVTATTATTGATS